MGQYGRPNLALAGLLVGSYSSQNWLVRTFTAHTVVIRW